MKTRITHRLRMLLAFIAVAVLATGAAALEGPAAPQKHNPKPAAAKAAAKSKAGAKKTRAAAKRATSRASAALKSKNKSATARLVPTSVNPATRPTLASAIATGPVPPAFTVPNGLAP